MESRLLNIFFTDHDFSVVSKKSSLDCPLWHSGLMIWLVSMEADPRELLQMRHRSGHCCGAWIQPLAWELAHTAGAVEKKKRSLFSRSCRFFPILSSSFIVLCSTIKSVIYLEWVLLNVLRSVSRFIYPTPVCPIFPAPFVERLSLLYCIAFISLSKIRWPHIFMGWFFF